MHHVGSSKKVLIKLGVMVAAVLGSIASAPEQTSAKKPNILVIFGDDARRKRGRLNDDFTPCAAVVHGFADDR